MFDYVFGRLLYNFIRAIGKMFYYMFYFIALFMYYSIFYAAKVIWLMCKYTYIGIRDCIKWLIAKVKEIKK